MKQRYFASATRGFIGAMIQVLMGFGILAAPQLCPGQRSAPSVDELVGKMMKQEEQNQKAAVHWKYDQHLLTQRLDGMGKVKSEKKEEIKSGSAGKMSFFVRASEKENENSQTSFTVGNKADQEKEGESSEIFSISELKPFYDFSIGGEDKLGERNTWLLDFEPKKALPKAENQAQKVLKNLRGRLWVDKVHYAIMRADCALVRPTPFAWFDLVSLRELKIHYETFFYKDKVWLPKGLEVEYLVRLLYISQIHERSTMTATNYQKKKE